MDSAARSSLLVIDVQSDFSESDGKTPVCREQADEMIGAINAMTDLFSATQLDIIHIFHEWNNPIIQSLFGDSVAKGTPGADLDRRLTAPAKIRFTKPCGNAFINRELSRYLRSKGISRLYITGVAAEYCVKSTITGALQEGYEVIAVSDGIAAKNGKKRDKAFDEYARSGATVLSSSAVIAGL